MSRAAAACTPWSTDRTVSRVIAGPFSGYVIRSAHWDNYRAEVWGPDGRAFQAARASKRSAETLVDRAVVALLEGRAP